jgi:ribosomal protein S18 acetylase RimI-like enzyme
MVVRAALPRDIPGIAALLLQVLAVHNAIRPDLFKPVGAKYTGEEIEKIIADPLTPVFVCVDGVTGTVLGHCFCKVLDKPETGATYPVKSMFIDDLCVEESVRGKHIGSKLLDFVTEYARDNGFYNITLHAWEGNDPALAFYRNSGFTAQQYTLELKL